jgi:signal transduction histidine kinase
MHRIIAAVAGAVLMSAAVAEERMAVPDEAKLMSQNARDTVNEMGSEKAFAAFADPNGVFQKIDLYVFCMDHEGVMLSHAKKPELVGKNLKDFNKYGDNLFQDMIAVSTGPGEGWVDYKWPYPGTEEIKEKTSYIIKNNEGFFCGVGAYK